MTVPETCPHCGAREASFPEAFSTGFYACDTCVYDDRTTQRGTPCYEAEIAHLRAENARLRRISQPPGHRRDSDSAAGGHSMETP